MNDRSRSDSEDGLADLRRCRVLVYGMNFAPELIGVGKYTGELCCFLASDGADVRVITTPPHYPGWEVRKPYTAWRYRGEVKGGAKVTRCPLLLKRPMKGIWRLIAPMSFALSSAPVALWQAIRQRPNTVVVVEPTLFIAPIALFCAWLVGARTLLHVQDLEVDAAFAMGHLDGASVFARMAFAFERFLLRRFDCVVSISNKMIERLQHKGVSPDRTVLIRNWVDITHVRPLPTSSYRPEFGIGDDTFVVLYSGNLGAKQGLGVLLEAARLLNTKEPSITFVIAGEGPHKADLMRGAEGLSNVRFAPLQPYERLPDFLNLADLHVIPQERAAADLVLPSKLGGILATGRPLIVTADETAEIADFLGSAAVIVPPGDTQALANGIAAVKRAKDTGADAGRRNARLDLANCLSREGALSRFGAAVVHKVSPHPRRLKTFSRALAFAIGLAVLAELGARALNLVSVPLYVANANIGYIPKAGTQGSFLHLRDWAFNELSMGTPRPFTPKAEDILLVGDSLVFGGTPFKEQERLGPQLEAATKRTVWPISAGSWALQNELTYIANHRDALAPIRTVVFVVNSGDFGAPSSWTSELSHPRAAPWCHLCYFGERYLLPSRPGEINPSLTVAPREWRQEFSELAKDHRIVAAFYPTKSEFMGHADLKLLGAQLSELGAAKVLFVQDAAGWSPDLYRDEIHPTARGNEVLAEFIGASLRP